MHVASTTAPAAAVVVFALVVTCIAPGVARGQAAPDEIDLDAPDVGAAPGGKTAVPRGRPALDKTPPPAAGSPASTGGPTSASASPDTPAAPPAVPPPTVSPPDAVGDDQRASNFAVRPWSPRELRAAADVHFAAVARGDRTEATRTLSTLERALVEAGVHGLEGGPQAPAIAAALAREAAALVVAGDDQAARAVVDLASRAAPDDVGVAARVAYVRARLEGVRGADAFVDVLQRIAGEPVRVADVVVRLGCLFGGAVLALLAVWTLLVAVPALRLLGFDLWIALPRGSHRLQGLALVAVVAAAPAVLGAGVVVVALWWLTLAYPYLVRRVRVLVVLTALAVAALPLVIEGVARAIAVAGGDAAVIAAALYDVEADDARAALRARAARGQVLPPIAEAALATAALREGRIDESVDRWRALVQRTPEPGWAHGGFGVALAAAGRDDVAIAELNLATQRAGREATVASAAAFDAAVMHQQAGRSDSAQATLRAVVGRGGTAMAKMRRATFRDPDEVVHHNRAFVEVLPPRRALRALLVPATPTSDAVALALGRPLWGMRLRGAPLAAALAGVVVVWLVMGVVGRRVRWARACVRCGAPASRRVDPPEAAENTCSACFQAFSPRRGRSDATARVRQERAILRRGRVRAATVLVATLLLPGAGHVFHGAVVRGALLVVLTVVLGGASLLLGGAWPASTPLGPWPAWVLASMPALVLAFVVVGVIRAAVERADDERNGLTAAAGGRS